MSETPPRPDGSDPRVLTPDADEPEVWVASGSSSNAKTYHTNHCATVDRMGRPTQVPLSVARWRDHEKCERCELIDSDEDYPRPGTSSVNIAAGYHTVTALRCLILRALALDGYTHADAAAEIDVTKSTATRHISGSCECDHHGHSVSYDESNNPTPAGDGGVPDALGGQVIIPATACANMRRLLAESPVPVPPVAELFGTSDAAVRRHVKNADRCHHEHSDLYPPVRYNRDAHEWVVNR